MNYTGGQYLFNGRDIFTEYGLVIIDGKSDLLKLPKRKDIYEFDWPDENGKDFDLTNVALFDDIQITFKCYMIAENYSQFMANRYRLLSLFKENGTITLQSIDMMEEFSIFYLDNPSSNFATRKIKGDSFKAWNIDLQFQVVGSSVVPPVSGVLSYGFSSTDPFGFVETISLNNSAIINSGEFLTTFNHDANLTYLIFKQVKTDNNLLFYINTLYNSGILPDSKFRVDIIDLYRYYYSINPFLFDALSNTITLK